MWKTLMKGVSEKFIEPEKEVTYQAGQIQIQVKADPVGPHRSGHWGPSYQNDTFNFGFAQKIWEFRIKLDWM